jgi:hypothetical protein
MSFIDQELDEVRQKFRRRERLDNYEATLFLDYIFGELPQDLGDIDAGPRQSEPLDIKSEPWKLK